MRSLRFRLPAFFLLGVVLAGVVTGVITVRLFQGYTEGQTVGDLHRQARELARLYEGAAIQSIDENAAAPRLAAPRLEAATGTKLYYVGTTTFPGQISGLRPLSIGQAGLDGIPDVPREITFVPPGEKRQYLAIVQPVQLGGVTFGSLVVAKPKAELGERWLVLLWRAGLGLLAGLGVAAGLFMYLSRRVTKPLRALSRAADAVARGSYDVSLPAVRSKDEIGQLADSFRDMTGRLAAATELERNFLMTVSHELRTPLTAIRGHVDALREGLAEDPESREASLDVIATESDRLSRLVGDLLDLAKLDTHRFTLLEEEVDLAQLLEQAYQGFAEEARRREIAFERDVDGAPVITTDGDRVLQIVSNVLGNAFQWTPDGGTVRLRLVPSGAGSVSVAVEDSGPGVAGEDREHVFRPFWSRNGHGTGLGLAIARELAQALGGRLELDPSYSAGARFLLGLPAGPGRAPVHEVALRR
jgi:two-component system OmpR family sensor kinase